MSMTDLPKTVVPFRKSPKQASRSKDNKLIRRYGNYLGGDKGKDEDKETDTDKGKDGSKKINIHRKPTKRSRDHMKIVRSKDKGQKSPNKPFDPSMDINEIEKQAQLFSKKEDTKAENKPDIKPEPKPGPKPGPVSDPETKPEVAKPNPEVAKPEPEVAKPNPEVAKPNPEVAKRPKKGRRSRRSRLTKRHKTKGRRIRIRKKEAKAEDLKQIEQKINSIRNKKPRDIRDALLKDGIQVSGKSNRLLQDIYFYSKVCNINIKHEA